LGQNAVTAKTNAASGLSGMAVSAGSCASGDTTSNVTVTATYPFTYDIPFFGSKTITLTAKGVMRCGG
jgi:hypothetical protein